MLREVKSRILLEEDVIKAVDKHTKEDGSLDNDISCILEEVKSVVIMGSKVAMENMKVEHSLPKTKCNIPMPDVKSPKREDSIEEELQNYICDLCDAEKILIDLRFACLGDENMFYEEEKGVFSIRCEHYHVDNISEVKKLIANTYLVRLWQQAKSYQMIALYIRDIVNTGNGYNVIVGGQLFKNTK